MNRVVQTFVSVVWRTFLSADSLLPLGGGEYTAALMAAKQTGMSAPPIPMDRMRRVFAFHVSESVGRMAGLPHEQRPEQ